MSTCFKVYGREMVMNKKVCEACGYKHGPEDIGVYRVIPELLSKQDKISDSATVQLCKNCRNEMITWYSRKVADQIYDPAIKRFRYRSPAEMVKEYEAAYRAFAEYKKRQRKRR